MLDPSDGSRGRGAGRFAHLAWLALGISISVLLVFGGEGHPPPLVFLPLVLLLWVLGHLGIWGAGRLAAKGRRAASGTAGGRGSWPAGLRLALLATGIGASIGVLQAAVSLYLGRWYPYRDAGLWSVMIVVWVLHGGCFVGLLLRRRWSRILCLLLASAWALLLASRIIDSLVHDTRVEIFPLLTLSGLMAALLVLVRQFAASERVKSFLDHRAREDYPAPDRSKDGEECRSTDRN